MTLQINLSCYFFLKEHFFVALSNSCEFSELIGFAMVFGNNVSFELDIS